MPPAPRVLHLASGDPVGVYAVETWLRTRDLPAVVCHEALECAALMLSEPQLAPEAALIGAAWLDASEYAIIDCIRERWPAIRIIVYGRDGERLVRRGDTRCCAIASDALAAELEHLAFGPRSNDAPPTTEVPPAPAASTAFPAQPEPPAEIGKNCTFAPASSDEVSTGQPPDDGAPEGQPLSDADWDAQVEAELAAARSAAEPTPQTRTDEPAPLPAKPPMPPDPVPPVTLGGPLDPDELPPLAAGAAQTLLTREELAALLRDEE